VLEKKLSVHGSSVHTVKYSTLPWFFLSKAFYFLPLKRKAKDYTASAPR